MDAARDGARERGRELVRTTASRRCALVQWALCSAALTAAALLTRAVLHPAGVDLPLDATLTLALVLGLVGSPAARLRIEALASGRSAVPVLFAWCAGLAALLTWLGIGVLVPAAATGAAMHAVVVAPQRRRAVQSFVITAVVTAGSLTAEGLGRPRACSRCPRRRPSRSPSSPSPGPAS